MKKIIVLFLLEIPIHGNCQNQVQFHENLIPQIVGWLTKIALIALGIWLVTKIFKK